MTRKSRSYSRAQESGSLCLFLFLLLLLLLFQLLFLLLLHIHVWMWGPHEITGFLPEAQRVELLFIENETADVVHSELTNHLYRRSMYVNNQRGRKLPLSDNCPRMFFHGILSSHGANRRTEFLDITTSTFSRRYFLSLSPRFPRKYFLRVPGLLPLPSQHFLLHTWPDNGFLSCPAGRRSYDLLLFDKPFIPPIHVCK